MPDNDDDFKSAASIISFFTELKKNVCLLVRDFRVSLIPHRERTRYIEYGINDFSKLYQPSKRLTDELKHKNIDLILDLNLQENIFCTIAANLIDSKFRICFMRGNSDKFYNFQIINNYENNSAISYENLLNSLQMF